MSARGSSPVVAAPSAAPRAPIVELGNGRDEAFLVGRAGSLGGFWVETEDGYRVVDLRSEPRQAVNVLVPSKRKLFVRTPRGEAMFILDEGERATLDDITLRRRALHPRGALDVSMQRGLFAAAFGPAYYRGFVDNADGALVPVPLRIDLDDAIDPRVESTKATKVMGYASLGAAGALLIASGASGIAALSAKSDFNDAMGLEQRSADAADRYQTYGTVSLVTLISSAVAGVLAYALFEQE